MKTIFCLFSFAFAFHVIAQTPWPFIMNDQIFAELQFSEQTEAPVRLGTLAGRIFSTPRNQPSYEEVYGVSQELALSRIEGRWVKSRAMTEPEIVWADGETIGPSSVEGGRYNPSVLGDYSTPYITSFPWRQTYDSLTGRPLTDPEFVEPYATVATNRTSLLYGLKVFQDGDTNVAYYGWIELLRDRGDAFSQLRFGRHAVDYLPNRGIRAGREAERPALVSVVTPETTTLSWDPLYAANGFLLERAESLTPPVTWEPVETPPGATNVVLSNATSASALYRLARP